MMRLQLAIHRHALPPCHILFTTGSGPASQTAARTSTIFDLLTDVNAIVPLESADGEWGLEDYVVEVAATADQEFRYECLHFSEIRTVLREDDEVVIRGLKLEELRERRVGGRYQISGDGRHLVDGVGFGKRWVRAEMGRPGVRIPPRKKTRMLAESEDEATEGPLLGATDQFQLRNEEDEDGDYDGDARDDGKQLQIMARQDFEDTGDDSSSQDDDDDDVMPQEEMVLSEELKALLEDAEGELTNGDNNMDNLLMANVATTPRSAKRKRDVKDDDADLHDESEFEGFSTPIAPWVLTRTYLQDNASNSSSYGSISSVSSADSDEKVRAGSIFGLLKDDEMSSSTSSASDSEDGPTRSDLPGALMHQALLGAPSARDDEISSSSSSNTSDDDSVESEELDAELPLGDDVKAFDGFAGKLQELLAPSLHVRSESNSEDGADSNGNSEVVEIAASPDGQDSETSSSCYTSSSIKEASPDGTSSSSGSESSSDGESELSRSDVSSEGEAFNVEKKPEMKGIDKDGTKHAASSKLLNGLATVSSGTAPGQGSSVTRARNERLKKKSRLNSLKADGFLPPDADFAAMYAYEQQQQEKEKDPPAVFKVAESAQQEEQFKDMVEDKKQELLQQLLSPSEQDEENEAKHPLSNDGPAPFIGAVRHDSDYNKENVDENTPPTIDTPTSNKFVDVAETKSEPPKPRSRLDLASSRRLLFGSLGLRSPKTLAAEQALREKLSQSVRKHPSTVIEDQADLSHSKMKHVEPTYRGDSWRKRIILSAKECEHEGVTLTPPSFPFEQIWDRDGFRRMNKKKARNRELYYEDYQADQDEVMEGQGYAPNVSMLGQAQRADNTPTVQLKTLSSEGTKVDDLSRPDKFDDLPSLDLQDAVPGAVIAYKEWHINEKGEPGVSEYRVARVLTATDEGLISLALSKRDRDAAIRSKYDEVTGERLRSRFEAPVDDDEVEDDLGTRSILFHDLQEPKVVQSPNVQVPASNEDAKQTDSEEKPPQTGDALAVIPDSGRKEGIAVENLGVSATVEVSTPRRNEITSMIKEAGFDSALDEQLLEPISANGDAEVEESQDLDTSQQDMPADDHDNMKNTGFDNTGFESPHFNNLSSSPPRVDEPEVAGGEPFADEWQQSQISENSAPTSNPATTPGQIVLYPHISQLDITEASIVTNTNSSSHQDAQRIGQVPEVDISVGPSVANDNNDEDKDQGEGDKNGFDSLKSVIPPLENADPSEPTLLQLDSSGQNDSFLGLGLDGHTSLGSYPDYNDADNRSSNESDLPSLREIASSQVHRTRVAPREARLSPPPLTRSERLRNGKKWKGEKSSQASSINCPSSQSQPDIKISASQRDVRLSQIPEGTYVVDLTMSSDPFSPGGSVGEYGVSKNKRSGKTASKGANGTNKGKAVDKSKDAAFDASSERSSVGMGLGKKKFLVLKKTKSRI